MFDSSGICVLTCFKEVSRRPVLGDLKCHFVQPHVFQMGMSGPREGTPVAQLGAPEASGRTRTSAQSRVGGSSFIRLIIQFYYQQRKER